MKPITLHPTSLLAGLALATLAFFAMAQSPQPATPTLTRPTSPAFIRAQDMVRITEGTPYVVPPQQVVRGHSDRLPPRAGEGLFAE
jgi:hypothetical protein